MFSCVVFTVWDTVIAVIIKALLKINILIVLYKKLIEKMANPVKIGDAKPKGLIWRKPL